MARITQFNAPVQGLEISDRASAAFESLARTQRVYGQQEKANLDETGRELNSTLQMAAKELNKEKPEDKASKHDDLMSGIEIDKAHADLNLEMQTSLFQLKKNTDPSKFREAYADWTANTLEPALQKHIELGEGKGDKGLATARSNVNSSRMKFMETGGTLSNHADGEAVSNGISTIEGTYDKIALSEGTPEGLGAANYMARQAYARARANSGIQGHELELMDKAFIARENERNFKTAQKMIREAPDHQAAFDLIKKHDAFNQGPAAIGGVHDTSGKQWGILEDTVGKAIKEDQTNLQHLNIQLKQGAERDFNKMAGDMIDDLHTKGPSPGVFDKIREWRNDPAHPERLEQVNEARLNQFYESYRKEAGNRDDPTKLPDQSTLEDIRKRLGSGQIVSVDELYKAKADGKISKDQYAEFHARSKELSTVEGKDLNTIRKEFVEGQKLTIDPQYGQTKYPQGSPLGTAKKVELDMALRKAETALGPEKAKSLYDPSSPNYFGKPENMQRFTATKADNIVYEKQIENQAKQNNGVTDDLLNHLKKEEGFTPAAKWDFKQNSWGYGTKAPGPGLTIDKTQAEVELKAEAAKAAREVDAYTPSAPPGVRNALISLTFNSGTKWQGAGLGAAIKAGDWTTAKERFIQYEKAGGETNAGLTARRGREAVWFDKAIAAQQAALPMARTPTEAMEKFKPGDLFRTPEGRVLRVPRKAD